MFTKHCCLARVILLSPGNKGYWEHLGQRDIWPCPNMAAHPADAETKVRSTKMWSGWVGGAPWRVTKRLTLEGEEIQIQKP